MPTLTIYSCCWILCLAAVHGRDIVVDEINGRDSPECFTLGIWGCRTLQYAVARTSSTNNIRYLIKSSTVTINSTITFYHRKEIILTNVEETDDTASVVIVQCKCVQPDEQCGLKFIESNSVQLQGLAIFNCSISINSTGNPCHKSARLLTGLYFEACRNVYLFRVIVSRSKGFGSVMINSIGRIIINNSVFVNNSVIDVIHDNVIGGGGLLIYESCENTVASMEEAVNYTIFDSYFINNYVNMAIDEDHHWYHLVYGGGLNVFIDDHVIGRKVMVSDCAFTNNTSYGGGGMVISLGEDSTMNNVNVERCNFTGNKADIDRRGGGGGLTILIASSEEASSLSADYDHGHINITGCRFTDNLSKFGGGTAVLLGDSIKLKIHILFSDCQWFTNVAPISAAAYIGPSWHCQDRHDFIAHTYICNCTFFSNELKPSYEHQSSFKGKGIALISRVKVNFIGTIRFYNNKNTALYVDSTYLKISDNSSIEFEDNHGDNGGAIRLEGFSGIHYKDGVTFKFIRNKATFLGGAIYSENADQLLSILSQTCIFQPSNLPPENVYFLFENNTSGTTFAESIYLTSIKACQRTCMQAFPNATSDPFNTNCYGIFKFSENDNKHYYKRVSTDVAQLYINYTAKGQTFIANSSILEVIPGFATYIALRTKDDYNHETTVIATFYVNLFGNHYGESIRIDTGTRIINNNHIIIHGVPGLYGNLSITPQTKSAYTSNLILEFKLVPCPPGYILINNSCVCSAIHQVTYEGISECSSRTGLLLPGYWAGYILKHGQNVSEDTLYIGDCPKSYCRAHFTNSDDKRLLHLTPHASQEDLEKLMCSQNRIGTMCGDCKPNHSVFYNSDAFYCHRDKYCEYGIIFFIIIDFIPIGILFAVLLTLNISLTSGVAYSVIFMVQQVHVLEITVRGAILFKSQLLIGVANAIYSLFNMEFLNIELLSFCLWSGARTMDVLVIKYFSILFSVALVVSFTLLMNYCSCNFIKNMCRKNRTGSSYSIAQGLTAFLVMCYTQTTRITFNILNRGVVYGKNYENHYKVVFLDGETMYFQGRHLWYAIPAVLFLFIIVIPPPFLLLFDPLFSKVEDKLSCRFQPWTRIKIRLKPILDSFQNCFKDNMRWFAGMYFLYRTIILVLLITSSDTLQYYFYVQVVLIIFFTLHSIFQPFVKTKHNIIGALCLFNLVLINYLTICIYSFVTTRGYGTQTRVYQWIQVSLIYLPIIVGIGLVMKFIVTRYCLKENCNRRRLLEITFEDGSSLASEDTIDILFNRTTSYQSLETDSTHHD